MEDDRSLVYDIFERYEHIKQEHQDVDDVDRVVRIMSALRQNSSLKQLLESTIEEVYIDEVQDQRCVDFELLLGFIKDSRGLHFAGDTAQAISQDSTLRFADVKAIIYEHFAPASAYANQSQLAQTTMFTLTKNYRSHQGILALATSVMGMICKGFPETVDKLEPEVGNLNGPKPVIFLGCDASILRTSNVGLVNLSDRVAEFGAEQVILVRDEDMKAKLQGQIGDIALILTILDSKGMEFDDVILWDFFTSSPDPSGVRKLCALTTEAQSAFDAQKHSAMCSELKHLYVAITRARLQLFLLESSEKAMISIVDLLTMDIPEPLVDVTRPYESGFPEKLKLLRPGTSVDPVRWSLRGDELMQRENYVDAAKCYSKARNHRGEAIANAKVYEEIGADYLTRNETQGFTQSIEAAINLYLKTNMIGDAAMNLGKLGRLSEAAELWQQHNETAKAAPLFAEAGLYVKAALCYRTLEKHSEAAAMLRRGSHFDQLVSHLDKFSEKLSPNSLKGYSLLCRLLLKQNKISPDFRSLAIKLLGSADEQEACFIEYGMNEELAGLYASQLRYIDLFHLYSKNGQLEQALSLAIVKDLLQSTELGIEAEILKLLDYAWFSRTQSSKQQHSPGSFNLPAGFLTPEVILRAKQWEACSLTYGVEGSIARQHVVSMSNRVPKTVYCLRKMLNDTAITGATHLDDLPFEMMQETISFARNVIINKDSNATNIVHLLAGVWKSEKGKGSWIVLPWSPLGETLAKASNTDLTRVVTQWVLDGLVSAILALDTKARGLWEEKWPKRCAHFITIGFCPRQRKGEPCNFLHQAVSEQDCSQIAKDLLLMNGIFCALTAIYYRRAMNETFQQRYLGIKRYWLERLLRELTHLSAVEQHASIIVKTQAQLCNDREYIAILSSIEELLYFRLVKEWSERSSFTSLLEQLQLAKAFGSNLQNRLFRVLSHRLFLDQRGLMQRHLSLLTSLTENVGCSNTSLFQDKLMMFLVNLEKIEIPALLTLHSLTGVIEYLSAHLILKTCATACIIPNSWIDLHIKSTSKAIQSSEPLKGDDKHRYHGCLIQLAKGFCHILSRLDKAALPVDSLLRGGRTHQSLLLRQRNAELVAVIVANLAATFPEPPAGFNEIWERAKEVFDYDFVKAYHLRSRTSNELTLRLPASFAKYNGKDALVVVIRDRTRGSPFRTLEHQPGVRIVTFDQLYPSVPTPAAAAISSEQTLHSAPADGADAADDQYSVEETEAMIRIQRLWRSVLTKIQRRRSYISDPECRAIARHFNMSAQCSATTELRDRRAMRRLLVSQGVSLRLRLGAGWESLSGLQRDAMACVENVEVSVGVFESVDAILGRNREVEPLLRKGEEQMSDEHLAGLVKEGILSDLEEALKNVETIIVDVERNMSETRRMIGTVSGSYS